MNEQIMQDRNKKNHNLQISIPPFSQTEQLSDINFQAINFDPLHIDGDLIVAAARKDCSDTKNKRGNAPASRAEIMKISFFVKTSPLLKQHAQNNQSNRISKGSLDKWDVHGGSRGHGKLAGDRARWIGKLEIDWHRRIREIAHTHTGVGVRISYGP